MTDRPHTDDDLREPVDEARHERYAAALRQADVGVELYEEGYYRFGAAAMAVADAELARERAWRKEMQATARGQRHRADNYEAKLRRMADEAQQAREGGAPAYDEPLWEQRRRDAKCGCTAPSPADCNRYCAPSPRDTRECPCHYLSRIRDDRALVVLPAPADRAAVLCEAANGLAALGPLDSLVSAPAAWTEAIETLRLMADQIAEDELRCVADEAQPAGEVCETPETPTVAYRDPNGGTLYCASCGFHDTHCTPVTSDDLPDGGLCADCGIDVLIPQAGEGGRG